MVKLSECNFGKNCPQTYTYSGLILERYFKQVMAESFKYRDIGSWWNPKNKENQCEIDIIALGAEKNRAFAYEVKRNRNNYNPKLFEDKVNHFKTKVLPRYTIEFGCFSMDNM